MGGMAVGMAAAGGFGGMASSAIGAAGTGNPYGGSAAANGDHLPIGASDGPAGLSASTGRNPFGSSKASSAWASLPAVDPDLPGIVAPGPPALAKSGPSAPEANVQVPVTAEGLNNSVEVTSGLPGSSRAVQQSSLSSETSSAPRRRPFDIQPYGRAGPASHGG
jgi:hypothetical protein